MVMVTVMVMVMVTVTVTVQVRVRVKTRVRVRRNQWLLSLNDHSNGKSSLESSSSPVSSSFPRLGFRVRFELHLGAGSNAQIRARCEVLLKFRVPLRFQCRVRTKVGLGGAFWCD